MSSTAAFQSNVTSTPLSFDAPALMYETFVAVAPPVDGLRMIRWHAEFAASNVGLLSGLRHARYTASPGSGAIIPLMRMRYQSTLLENPASSGCSHLG